jgi:hypothetical protein
MQTMHKSQNAKNQDFVKMQKGMKEDFNLSSFKILVVYGKWIQSTRA